MNHCQIRQLNPILHVHIQNPSPEYPFSATADVRHHLSDSSPTTQVTAVASFPHHHVQHLLFIEPEFPLPSCGLLTLHHKPSGAFLHSATLKNTYSLQKPAHLFFML